MQKFRVVVATQKSQEAFFNESQTGLSMRQQIHGQSIDLRLHASNSTGLPALYNAAIDASRDDPCYLVFMHDDLCILDYHWLERIAEGLETFDVLGVVGSKRRHAGQSSWAFVDPELQVRESIEHTSGYIGFGKTFPPDYVGVYGPSGQAVKLLDGLMLCAKSSTLINHGLRFDERFGFHFYDLDFCRHAEQKQLQCGTWPISLIHESLGDMDKQSWRQGYATYMEKWGD